MLRPFLTARCLSNLGKLLLCCGLVACGSPSDPETEAEGTGGASTGGALSTGGGSATGGAAVGGVASSGGTAAGGSGGAPSSGGAGSGGALGTGGGALNFEPCPVAPEPCKIMPSGDSITVGAQSTDTGGYRVPLFRAALESEKNITFVGPSGAGPATVDGVTFPENHDGHSGYIIDTIDTRKGLLPLVEQNLEKFSPHIMLLMIGTNDINTELELESAPTRLAAVIDKVTETSPETLLVVAQLIPTRTDSLNVDVQAYNAAMKALVAERAQAGKHIVLVDMYSAFTRNQSYKDQLLFDGLHPNDAGYAVMADVWYDAIEAFLH